MLRPATPLAILFFAAFVLLLLSTLSTPIIQAIPLAESNGVTFGVFGYCDQDGCSKLGIGYPTSSLTEGNSPNDFSLPVSTRHSLSSILIVHPVAALLCLMCFALAVAAHFHAPSHSPRYLLALLILIIPAVLVSLLAFLVDILVFNPHVQWGGWIVLAATIIIISSMVVTCAMRRTLVSRKARKKRIAENAEMSGENYYNQRAAADMNMAAAPPSTIGTMSDFPKAESPPPMPPTTSTNSDKETSFATFDLQRKNGGEERMPLNSNGAAPGRGRSGSNGGWRGHGMSRPNDPFGPPQREPYGGPGMASGGPMAIGAMDAMGRYQESDTPMGLRGAPRGRGGPSPVYGRGRGGYGPPRGGLAPRGAPYGRGGMRGGPMGYGGPGRGAPMMGRGGMQAPPPIYGQSVPPPDAPSAMNRPYDGSTYVEDAPRGMDFQQNPGPIGQAVEMDERNGMPSPTLKQTFGLRDSDADVQGMLAMQQQRSSQYTEPMSPTSVYSDPPPFVPARSNWNTGPPANSASDPSVPQTASSIQTPHTGSSAGRALSPIAHSPVNDRPGLAQSESYYEDPDPSFAAASSPPRAKALPMGLPASLMAGGGAPLTPGAQGRAIVSPPPPNGEHLIAPQTAVLDRNSSTSSLPEGARSPAASDTSHYTSVSQRGINPNWDGPRAPPPPLLLQQQQQRRGPGRDDIVLGGNPDFSLPGVGPPGRGGRGGFRGRGGAGMGPPREAGPSAGFGMTPQGRYPDAI